uniref:C-type lectin domain-containing protein n=1 Tax=Sinocyclocheilus grahami TaxID=75366 RepID=A0A672K321_SINGR
LKSLSDVFLMFPPLLLSRYTSDMTHSSTVFVLHVVFDQSLSSFCLWFVLCPDPELIVIRENLMWSEALRYCRQNHVDLVSVHSEEIQRRVMNLKKIDGRVWIGLQKTGRDKWQWSSGEPALYLNWATGQPENNNSGHSSDTKLIASTFECGHKYKQLKVSFCRDKLEKKYFIERMLIFCCLMG